MSSWCGYKYIINTSTRLWVIVHTMSICDAASAPTSTLCQATTFDSSRTQVQRSNKESAGLGPAWEANDRMPAIVRWKGGGVPEGETSSEMASTLTSFLPC
eukprot:scaffold5966_cov75-Skeletonema_dohrnii-CCMP3373.AAC.3